jgi:hypothetical protein
LAGTSYPADIGIILSAGVRRNPGGAQRLGNFAGEIDQHTCDKIIPSKKSE